MVSADSLTQGPSRPSPSPILALMEVTGSENSPLRTWCLCEVTQPSKNKPGAEMGKNVQEWGVHPIQRSWGRGDLHGEGGERIQLIQSGGGCPRQG